MRISDWSSDVCSSDLVHVLAVQAPRFGVAEHEFLPRTGDADVGQPALLLQPPALFHRARIGKQPFLHPRQEHQREFQTLRAVQGHQLHAVLAGLRLALAGLQRGIGEEGDQLAQARALVLVATHKARGDRDQLVEVLRSEEHTSEHQSLMRTSYAVFCLKKKKPQTNNTKIIKQTKTNKNNTPTKIKRTI